MRYLNYLLADTHLSIDLQARALKLLLEPVGSSLLPQLLPQLVRMDEYDGGGTVTE